MDQNCFFYFLSMHCTNTSHIDVVAWCDRQEVMDAEEISEAVLLDVCDRPVVAWAVLQTALSLGTCVSTLLKKGTLEYQTELQDFLLYQK